MKQFFKFFTVTVFLLALCTCENDQVIALLRAPSELDFLEITAYADEFQLTGGAAMEPNFRSGVFEYTVYVEKDVNRFTVSAGINANGSVVITSIEDQITGTEFDYLDDEPKVLRVIVQREYMLIGEYLLTITRGEVVPTAKDVQIHLTPEVGTFFIGRGVTPTIYVTANLPIVNGEPTGELSYQWYINTENNTRTGYPISGAVKDRYTMLVTETLDIRTVYYYAEIINTIDGKQGVTKSAPRSVTFVNKYELDPKSLAMVNIPAGNVNGTLGYKWNSNLQQQWNTPGFLIGQNLVTYELWDTVRHNADLGVYRFAQSGNQGFTSGSWSTNIPSTDEYQLPVGNGMHPVTFINWRTAVIWCNAFSEMDNLQPVYVDSDGNTLRDSRAPVEFLVDKTKMAGKNGYRLPTPEEWLYAARGANPQNASPWNDQYPGTDDANQLDQYLASYSYKSKFPDNENRSIEVGSLRPNSIGLYDMSGLLDQFIWWEDPETYTGLKDDLSAISTSRSNLDYLYVVNTWIAFIDITYWDGSGLCGLRIVRNKE